MTQLTKYGGTYMHIYTENIVELGILRFFESKLLGPRVALTLTIYNG